MRQARKAAETGCIQDSPLVRPQDRHRVEPGGPARRPIDPAGGDASCEEDGIEPRKPFSGKLNLRLGPDLHQRVAQFAAESGLSMNSWILQALEKSVSREIENR